MVENCDSFLFSSPRLNGAFKLIILKRQKSANAELLSDFVYK